jgi:hypothetical protein
MKIYVAHTRDSDFQNELYKPIKESVLFKEHTFVLPHDGLTELFNSKKFFETDCDLVIAEVSNPAIGLGIELGWANMLDVPIACIYLKGSKLSNSLKAVTKTFLEYNNPTDLIEKIQEAVKITQ